MTAVKCHHQIYVGVLVLPYRSEHTLAGKVPGLGDRKTGPADKGVISAQVMVVKHQDWKG